jgi:hypothetical protein
MQVGRRRSSALRTNTSGRILRMGRRVGVRIEFGWFMRRN